MNDAPRQEQQQKEKKSQHKFADTPQLEKKLFFTSKK